MNMREQFAAAVRSCPDLPAVVRDAVKAVGNVEASVFDRTYLEFLGEQIQLNARGDAWSARLRRRRDGLAQWCDRELIDGTIVVNVDDYWIKVDPKTGKVVYWEHYPDSREA